VINLKAANKKGAITVFLSIVLSSIFLVIGTFSDAARICLGHSQVQRANKTALSSLLACYNNELKNEYGLFGLYEDNDSMQESFEGYFTKNLNISNNQNFLYDFKVESINIEHPYYLENKNVFEKQIMEFMKYRAPNEIAQDLISKVNGIKNISNGAKVCQRKMETDQKANEIGILQISLENITKKINQSDFVTRIAVLKTDFSSIKSNFDALGKQISDLQTLYTNQSDESEKKDILDKIIELQKSLKETANQRDGIKRSIINCVNEFKNANSDALDNANIIITKMAELLKRINSEFQYIKQQDEIGDLQQAYQNSLFNMKNIISEDNSASIADMVQSNILKCSNITDTSYSDENNFISAMDDLANLDNINYTFNKANLAESYDRDNRDKVENAVKETLNSTGDGLKIIDDSLLERLPSKKEKAEEAVNSINTDVIDFKNDSYITGSLESIASVESGLGQLISKAGEQLYVNEYIMGTFIHDVPLLQGEEKSRAYNLHSKEKTSRDAYFSKYEVEYIINGNKSESINSKITKSEILAIRMISNVIHIYSDPSKMSRVNGLAAALSSWSAGLSTPLIQNMLIFSWAMAESLYDLNQLLKGGKILLFKTEMQWKTDLSGGSCKSEIKDEGNNPLLMSYQDYLRIFLLLMDKETKLARTQDLVQLNIGLSKPGFLIEDCMVLLRAKTTVTMKNMFFSFPDFTTKARKSLSRTYVSEEMCIGY
jgi:hypothetical protein